MVARRAAVASRLDPSAEIIDLGAGHPAAELLPFGALRSAADHVLGAPDPLVLGYGPERGSLRLRERLAAFLERRTGERADPERFLVTAGASQALDLLCTVLTAPGDVVVVADPTYHLALRTFADHGLRVLTVRSDADGPVPDELERLLARHRPRLVYLVPTHANPSGRTIARHRREAVLATVAAADGVTLIADDVYALLGFADDPPGRFGAGRRRAAALGSFSKILAPGIRLGWIEADPQVLARLEASGLVQSGGGLNPFAGALVTELLDGSLDGHVGELRAAYRARAVALVEALRAAFPDLEVGLPAGGYFVWLRLPGIDAVALRPVAERHGVSFQPGSRFSPVGDFGDHLRLSFSRYGPDVLHDAASRLARAVESLHPSARRGSRHASTRT